MKTCKLTLAAIALLATSLHAAVRAHFPDNTAIEIFTMTTGPTRIDASGEIGILSKQRQDVVHRLIMDKDKKVLFGYLIRASHGTTSDSFAITIDPISEADTPRIFTYADGPPATVAATRNFPAVKIGEVVTLDVLYNPSTGERIYDVLRPVVDNAPNLDSTLSVRHFDPEPAISLKQIAVRINGAQISAPASLIVGSALRIEIPGHGAAILSTQAPHSDAAHPFTIAAHADGKTLTWKSGSDRIEITSETNILTQSATGDLWAWFDTSFKSPATVRLQAADTIESLLPGAKR